jgi:hypothetical protein
MKHIDMYVYCLYGNRGLETSQFHSYVGIHNMGGKFFYSSVQPGDGLLGRNV